MDEKTIIERVKARQGLISKMQNIFLGGYAVKEDLRELDKMLRDSYYEDFREFRSQWMRDYLEALESGQSSLGSHFKRVIQTIDRVSEQIHRGDYGYAGVFDRKGHIREDELARVFEFDRGFSEDMKGLREAVDDVHSNVLDGSWEETRSKIDTALGALLKIEKRWKGRESHFRSSEILGGDLDADN